MIKGKPSMSLFSRFNNIVAAKANKFLNAAEDTDAALELSYETMLSSLQETKRHLADVVAEQITLERQINTQQQGVARYEQDARLAMQAGREDLARRALTEKSGQEARLQTILASHEHVMQQAEKLKSFQMKLADRIDQFRTQKEVLKAEHQAASAQIKASESLAGIGTGLGNVGETMRRAQEKTQLLSAKAEAMERMMDEGVLDDQSDHQSQIGHEIEQLRLTSDVDAQMAKLRAELAAPEPVKSLPKPE
jgi:phage shock protein A